MSFNATPINAVTFADIGTLCSESVPESESIEFKENLSLKGEDQWAKESTFTERARNKILEEIIAFANAHGGRLIIGIRETDDKPPRADRVETISECHDLAERIAHAARDCVSPQIPLLNCRGVSEDSNTDGVVVIDVQESPLAPHRLEPNAHCYVRRADRSEKMSMREIQDLTIDRLRGHERSQARLDQLIATLSVPAGRNYYLQLVATPSSARIGLPWSLEPSVIAPSTVRFESSLQGVELELPIHDFNQSRRILRGWRWLDINAKPALRADAYWDGSIAAQYREKSPDLNFILFPEWVVAFVGNALLQIERLRQAAGTPDAEYALMFRIESNFGIDLMIYKQNSRNVKGRAGKISVPVRPPVYAVGRRESFNDLVSDIIRDVFNAAGAVSPDIGVKV